MKEIKITQGKVALVDDEDYEYLNQWKWCLKKKTNTCYAHRRIYLGGGRKNAKYKTVKLHRIILGILDPKILIDHIDGDGLNNQKYNLRKCSHSQNMMNKKTSKIYKGISITNGGKFISKITANGFYFYLGVFDTALLAAKAYNDAAIKYHGEFAKLNIIK